MSNEKVEQVIKTFKEMAQSGEPFGDKFYDIRRYFKAMDRLDQARIAAKEIQRFFEGEGKEVETFTLEHQSAHSPC